jgi:hypothetical protein
VGSLTEGTAGSATYTVTLTRNTGPGSSGAFDAVLSITTALPAGATYSFTSVGSADPNTVHFTASDDVLSTTLTITTTSATPDGVTMFTVSAAHPPPGNVVTTTGTLTIDEATNSPPVIVLGGSTGTENDGADQNFTWSVTDPDGNLSTVSVMLKQDGVMIDSSSAASGSFDFNPDGLGVFTIEVTATDSVGDTSMATRSVTVTDDDTAGPTIVLDGSGEDLPPPPIPLALSATEDDGETQEFTWDVSDISGVANVTVVVKQDDMTIFEDLDADVMDSFNFDSFGLGTFEITVTATDADGDWVGDSSTSSASRAVTVTDDDTEGPTIVLGGSTGTETECDTQVFTWDVSDDSGLSNVTVVVTKNGVTIFEDTDADAMGSFNFDDQGTGLFESSVTATDKDNDWDGDQSSSGPETRSVSVIVPAPTVTVETDTVKGGKMLLINGTSCCDSIVVSPGSNYSKNGSIVVSYFDGFSSVIVPGSPFTPAAGTRFSRIVIHSGDCDDNLQVAGTIKEQAWLYGEDGDDRLKGGAGTNILLGGDGEDLLIGGGGRNLLIGGDDADRLVGNGGDDIMIGGTTDHDDNEMALCKTMKEWTDPLTGYDKRVEHLKAGTGMTSGFALNAMTVHADGEINTMTGSSGQDLFFASAIDIVTDFNIFDTTNGKKKAETKCDIL